ncbi:MAG: rhodanese-like domain-containing protein [Deltaproteobacteria bacterium]|nr:rhodanese-like domain-containing protein [Deltaproteobacteria bacterium]
MVDAEWLSGNLDPSLVILDVRPIEISSKEQIKTAVSIPAGDILKLGNQYASKVRGKKKGEPYSKRILPSLADKKAPIILYGDQTHSKDVQDAYKELANWKYNKVAVLDGGFDLWKKQKRAVSNAKNTRIRYQKKLVAGAVSEEDFTSLQVSGKAVIVDVRTAKEQKKGAIKNAVLAPLEELDEHVSKIPKTGDVLLHCSTGVRAEIAYNILKKKGYDKVRFLNSLITIAKSGEYRLE